MDELAVCKADEWVGSDTSFLADRKHSGAIGLNVWFRLCILDDAVDAAKMSILEGSGKSLMPGHFLFVTTPGSRCVCPAAIRLSGNLVNPHRTADRSTRQKCIDFPFS